MKEFKFIIKCTGDRHLGIPSFQDEIKVNINTIAGLPPVDPYIKDWIENSIYEWYEGYEQGESDIYVKDA